MQLRIFTEPQVGATYDDVLAAARTTQDGGFDAFFRSDHYMTFSGDGRPGPTDAWITLAGLARETRRIRLGTLVTAATFRLPGPLAISVAQVDAMSGGRVEVGLGTGWYEAEHTAYGIPFPPFAERFERLGEQLEVVTGLWQTPVGERYSFEGRYYRLSDSPALPKPVQTPRPPVIVGGLGARRTPTLAARHADEYNVPFASVDDCRTQQERVDAACAAIGRAPESLRRSVALTVCCGRDSSEAGRRARAIGRNPESFGGGGIVGSPEDILAGIARYAATGVTRVYLQVVDIHDLAHIELLASDVLAEVDGAPGAP